MLNNILSAIKIFIPKSIFRFFQPYYHYLLNTIGAWWFGHPSRKMTIIGVTGTNGKTTVVNMVANILEENGIKTASVSSLRFKVGEREWRNTLKMTMPGRFALQKFLAQARGEGATHAVIEVTSEGIRQFRNKNIKWDILVFTNLTPEHIESHGSFEKYRQTKVSLFEMSHQTSIVNLDDENAKYFLQSNSKEKRGFYVNAKLKNKNENSQSKIKNLIVGRDVELEGDGIKFLVEGESFSLSLVGEFNVYNALAAISVGLSLRIPLPKIKRALEKIKNVPGRMEFIEEGQTFKVIVDYAHTPDSLGKVYKTIRDTVMPEDKKLICVLGATGGGRDKWKRAEFGRIAAMNCDEIIVTNEDPYDEDPKAILDQIELGFLKATRNPNSKAVNFHKILDRRDAIKKAIEMAGAEDAIIVTGKGAESLIMGARDSRIAWDEREVVREELMNKQ